MEAPPNTLSPRTEGKKRSQNKKKKKRSKKSSFDMATPDHQSGLPPTANIETECYVQNLKNIQRTSNKMNEASKQISVDTVKVKKKRKLCQNLNKKNDAPGDTEIGEQPQHPFEVDDTDHCETPMQAYQDVLDVLDQLAKSINRKRSTLRIYDPYYCDGGVKKKLASFGFTSVINRNRDFYDDIDKKLTPEYDILVTNPPYSGVHMEKILDFCSVESSAKQKPFLLLLPHFVYTKDYYQRALASDVISSMFFLVPEVRYSYIPPSWVEANKGSKALEQGKNKTAPFPSFWYCHAPKKTVSPYWLTDKFGPSGTIRSRHHSKLRYANSSIDIPRDFRGEFDPTKKRANPRARKRAAKKRRESIMRGGP
jgi:hypothetical protein